MAPIPDKLLDLFQDKPILAHLATIMPDGSPQVTPVWFDYKNGLIRVNTAKDRVKDRNMKAHPQVALSVLDPTHPFRYVQIRGKVTRTTEEGAEAHIDSLAKKYLGQEKYSFGQPTEVRVIHEIEPISIQSMDR